MTTKIQFHDIWLYIRVAPCAQGAHGRDRTPLITGNNQL